MLVNNNFEFPELLGAAYEYLIKFFADSAVTRAVRYGLFMPLVYKGGGGMSTARSARPIGH